MSEIRDWYNVRKKRLSPVAGTWLRWKLFHREAKMGSAHTSCHGVDIVELASHLLLDV